MEIIVNIHDNHYSNLKPLSAEQEFLVACCNSLIIQAEKLGKITVYPQGKDGMSNLNIELFSKSKTHIGSKNINNPKQPMTLKELQENLHKQNIINRILVKGLHNYIDCKIELLESLYCLVENNNTFNTLFYKKMQKYTNKNLSGFLQGELKEYYSQFKRKQQYSLITDNVIYLIPFSLLEPQQVYVNYYIDPFNECYIAFEDHTTHRQKSIQSNLMSVLFGTEKLADCTTVKDMYNTDPLLFYIWQKKLIYSPPVELSRILKQNESDGENLAFVNIKTVSELIGLTYDESKLISAIQEDDTEQLKEFTKKFLEKCFNCGLALLKPVFETQKLCKLLNI